MERFIIFLNRNKDFGLAILTGLLLFFSWPPDGFSFLVFVAFVPLFFIEDAFFRNVNAKPSYFFFIYLFIAFAIWNVLSTYWIINSAVIAFIVAVMLNSLLMAIPWLLMNNFRKILPGKTGPFMIIFLWISFEFLHLNWELSWPWLNLGNVFATKTNWVQWYEFTGTLGGTAWVLIVNLLFFYTLKTLIYRKTKFKILTFNVIALVLIIIIPILLSFHIGKNYEEPNDPVEVVIVQPGHDPYKQVSSNAEAIKRVNLMKSLAAEKLSPHTKFVVSPETSVPTTILLNHPENNPAVIILRIFSQQNNDLAWLAGSFASRIYYTDKRPVSTARKVKGKEEFYNLYNSAVFIQSEEPLQFNHKTKLVPGIERMPFYSLTKFLDPLIKKLGGIAGSFGLQKYRHVFVSKDSIAIGSLICYESVFGEFTSKYVKEGASVLFILTNDGWWGDTYGYKQHFHYARLRAIETRRSIARAASTGISGFIDQKGNVIKQTDFNEAIAIKDSINKNDKITFYTFSGDYIGRFSAFISALLVLYVITQYIIRRKNSVRRL